MNSTKSIVEVLDKSVQEEMIKNRQCFLKILEAIRYLCRQGIALRGNGDEGNFDQLLRVFGKFDSQIVNWLKRKQDKFTHHTIQNECIGIMALNILRQTISKIQKAKYYTIMADEVTDCSNKEQLVICLRWVDENFDTHEDLIGLHEVPNISADTLVTYIKDVLHRLNLNIQNCRGQCYDGASNMTGIKSGVSALIKKEEKKAILTHCYGHSLQLAVGDMIENIKLLKDMFDITKEINKLLKYSPKRDNLFS